METPNRSLFGRLPDGTAVEQIELRSGRLSCRIITYGGALRSLMVPDKMGVPVDVVLGFDSLGGYLCQDKYMGALIGRYANRIGGSRFMLGGKEYCLFANEGKNHLHGGRAGFDKQVWTVEEVGESTLTLFLFSPHMQEGYPGDMAIRVTYRLTEDALELDYTAQSSAETVCNLTNHAYFNLSGHGSGTVEDHLVQVFASRYTPVGEGSIPTGELASVGGTPMDLRSPRRVGDHVDGGFSQLALTGGYDHNWCLDGWDDTLRLAARVTAPDTGICMEVLTTMPGVQFYSGNYLDGCPTGKGGAGYGRRGGLCLETQFFPDSPNHKDFPDAVLRPGEAYHQTTAYRFR